jgi:hypothetical protein
MAGGLYSRLFTRPTGGTISGPNDDSEYDNIISNALPAKFDDYSATTGQMDSTKDPYPGSVQSLATSLAEELEHIRWVLDEMHGGTEWYISEQLLALSGGTLTGTVVFPLENDATTPTIGFGDGDSGFYESEDDTLKVSIAGAATFKWSGANFAGNAAGAGGIRNILASSTVPTIMPNITDIDTGVGWSTDTLHLIVNGTSRANITSSGLSGAIISDITGTAGTGKSLATDYLAATDLFVTAWITDTQTTLNGLSDSAGTPTTVVATNQAIRPFIAFFVKKGDYFRVTAGGGTVVIRDLPIGT